MKKAVKKIEKKIKELKIAQEYEEKKASKRYRQYNVANGAYNVFQSQINELQKTLVILGSIWTA